MKRRKEGKKVVEKKGEEKEVEHNVEKEKVWNDGRGRGRVRGRGDMTDVGHADCMIIASGTKKWGKGERDI